MLSVFIGTWNRLDTLSRTVASYKRLAPKVLENGNILRQPHPANLTLPERVWIADEDEQDLAQGRLF